MNFNDYTGVLKYASSLSLKDFTGKELVYLGQVISAMGEVKAQEELTEMLLKRQQEGDNNIN